VKPYLTIMNLLLIAGAGYLGYEAYGRFTASPVPAAVEITPAPEPSRQNKKVSKPASYTSIAQRNLFDTKTDEVAAPPKVDVEKLKQTKLKLKLWGTVTGSTEEPFAVIEEKGKRKQNLFRVGDVIQEATIKVILREKVVLTVDGKDEVLEMEKVSTKASRRPLVKKTTGAPTRPSPTVSSGEGQQKPGEQEITLNRGEMASAMQNVNELMRQVRIRPHFKDGKPDGLSFTGIRPNSIFRKMGLRNGDVITNVNEENITNVNDTVELFRQLEEPDGLELKIKRRGRDRLLKYTLE